MASSSSSTTSFTARRPGKHARQSVMPGALRLAFEEAPLGGRTLACQGAGVPGGGARAITQFIVQARVWQQARASSSSSTTSFTARRPGKHARQSVMPGALQLAFEEPPLGGRTLASQGAGVSGAGARAIAQFIVQAGVGSGQQIQARTAISDAGCTASGARGIAARRANTRKPGRGRTRRQRPRHRPVHRAGTRR